MMPRQRGEKSFAVLLQEAEWDRQRAMTAMLARICYALKGEGWTQRRTAKLLRLTPGRVNQLLQHPVIGELEQEEQKP